jgi:nicotinamidase-related amidase
VPLPERRHPHLLDRDAALLVVVDVQEAYRKALHQYERVASAVATMVQGAGVLGLPVVVTEQYPKGLGHTVAEVTKHFPAGVVVVEKRSLSCFGAPPFVTELARHGRRQIVLAGIEAHACMNQTAHDLIANGYQVHVVEEATSSRRPTDAAVGLEKMLAAGAIRASVESALLELLRTADAPEFKAIQRLIR